MSTRTLTGTAVLLALGVMLPIAFHALPLGGRVFQPMHVPALLAGLLLGPAAGLIVGAGSPVLSLLLTGRPPVPLMIPMALELATYGLVAGIARPRVERLIGARTLAAASEPPSPARGSHALPALLVTLLVAMIAGRAVWIAVVVWLAPLVGIPGRTTALALAALNAGWLGVAIQLALIPAIVRAIERPRIP